MKRKIKKCTLLLVSVLTLGMASSAGGAELMEFTDASESSDAGMAAGEFDAGKFDEFDGLDEEIPEVEFDAGESVEDEATAAFLAEGEVSETVTLDGIVYEYVAERDSCRVVKGVNVEKVTIPKEIQGKFVTEIGQGAFAGCDKLEYLDFGECKGEIVNRNGDFLIRKGAFENCVKLREIYVPNRIKTESNAFANCPRLTVFEICGDWEYTVENTFAEDSFDKDTKVIVYSCVNLSSDTEKLLDGLRIFYTTTYEPYYYWLKTINGMKFWWGDKTYITDFDDSLKEVKVRDPYKQDIIVGRKAFYGCTNMENVLLTNAVKVVETKAFYGCKNLKRVVIPESVTSIASDAFEKSPNVVIYTSVGSYASAYAKKHGIPCRYEKEKMKAPVVRYENGYLKWNQVLFASGYQVYKYDREKDKYVRIATSKDGKECSYDVRFGTIEDGATEYYKVRAYSYADIYSEKYSPSSKRVQIKKATAAPKVLSVSNKYKNKLVVKWNKPKGSEWFGVYRSETGKFHDYKRIKTIKDGNVTSYVDTDVERGKKYFYCVRAFRKFENVRLDSWLGSEGSNTCR